MAAGREVLTFLFRSGPEKIPEMLHSGWPIFALLSKIERLSVDYYSMSRGGQIMRWGVLHFQHRQSMPIVQFADEGARQARDTRRLLKASYCSLSSQTRENSTCMITSMYSV